MICWSGHYTEGVVMVRLLLLLMLYYSDRCHRLSEYTRNEYIHLLLVAVPTGLEGIKIKLIIRKLTTAGLPFALGHMN